ncbi:hypothetical protein HHK36_002198 [Tetracentron sinense]|uniref:glycerophosphodiester phosphodiesterase n=1 Tax=Tetracentron sinense TaxID=13715 RepID=A0A835DSS0_TETSI|nr:hypothetical protein HHK36_002198 [Tetracentron sinense]
MSWSPLFPESNNGGDKAAMPFFNCPYSLGRGLSLQRAIPKENCWRRIFCRGLTFWFLFAGNAPLVIAKGGFSGLFPDSSSASYSLALMTSLSNVVLWCDVQLTKDGAGICLPYLKLDNSTDISNVFTKDKVYLVNGKPVHGWFSVDYTLDDLAYIVLIQGIYSRTNKFDGKLFNVLTVEDVALQFKPPGLWLNIEHDAFFSQHNLSMRSFVLSVSRRVIINYVSSPEVVFLSSITKRFKGSRTKLVLRFLGLDDTEPSTNQTYGSLLKNLTFIKTIASGIIVPKTYIWPVDAGLYLQPHTSVVLDAHRVGLEVFASDFANDVSFSYNYSYDPIAEYLYFVDNGKFSVDGVLSNFPITPSLAIDCFSHISNNASREAKAKTLVISHNGASGMYPGCTDLAYKQAVLDGADVLDCPVQMTKDGIPFCFGSINLIDGTTVAQSGFSTRSIIIPEIQGTPGIFPFNFTWEEIHNLSPAISSPFRDYILYRNPVSKNVGTLITLADFLSFCKNMSNVSGILINIENAAYLAEKQGLSITDAVLDALSKAGYNNHMTKKVMIQSTNSSVLTKFKDKPDYELVYKIDEPIRDALNSTIDDIRKFADSVVVSKASIFPDNQAFLISLTDVVPKLHSYNLRVYVQLFQNEFVSQAWDFFSDPTVEINSFVMQAKIDGIITDFPSTAVAYRKNRCLNMAHIPTYMSPVEPGSLLQFITPQELPPAVAPYPLLNDSDVIEPPLPSISKAPISNTGAPGPALILPSDQPGIAACVLLSTLAMLLASLLLF